MDKKNTTKIIGILIAAIVVIIVLVVVIIIIILLVNNDDKNDKVIGSNNNLNNEIDTNINSNENSNAQITSDFERLGITEEMYENMYRYWAPMLSYYGYAKEQLPEIILDEVLLNIVIYDEAILMGYKLLDEEKNEIDSQFENEETKEHLQTNGINEELLKTFMYNNSVVTRYLEDKTDTVTEQTIRDYLIKTEGAEADLDLYKTRHILFGFKNGISSLEKQELLKEANKVLEQINKGANFSSLAEQYSDDTASAQNGGVFDMVNNTTVVKEYRKAVLELREGEVCPTIIETDYGYHIIKLDSIQKNGRLTMDSEVTNYINGYVADKMNSEYDRDNENNILKFNEIKQKLDAINNDLGIV